MTHKSIIFTFYNKKRNFSFFTQQMFAYRRVFLWDVKWNKK